MDLLFLRGRKVNSALRLVLTYFLSSFLAFLTVGLEVRFSAPHASPVFFLPCIFFTL